MTGSLHPRYQTERFSGRNLEIIAEGVETEEQLKLLETFEILTSFL